MPSAASAWSWLWGSCLPFHRPCVRSSAITPAAGSSSSAERRPASLGREELTPSAVSLDIHTPARGSHAAAAVRGSVRGSAAGSSVQLGGALSGVSSLAQSDRSSIPHLMDAKHVADASTRRRSWATAAPPPSDGGGKEGMCLKQLATCPSCGHNFLLPVHTLQHASSQGNSFGRQRLMDKLGITASTMSHVPLHASYVAFQTEQSNHVPAAASDATASNASSRLFVLTHDAAEEPLATPSVRLPLRGPPPMAGNSSVNGMHGLGAFQPGILARVRESVSSTARPRNIRQSIFSERLARFALHVPIRSDRSISMPTWWCKAPRRGRHNLRHRSARWKRVGWGSRCPAQRLAHDLLPTRDRRTEVSDYYELGRRISGGLSGEIFVGTARHTGEKVAIKVYHNCDRSAVHETITGASTGRDSSDRLSSPWAAACR